MQQADREEVTTVGASADLIDMLTLEAIAPVLRNAAHPLRLRILDYLFTERKPKSVGEIVRVSGVPQAIVSQHLRILRDQRILAARRRGAFVLYEVRNPRLRHLLECIRAHDGSCYTAQSQMQDMEAIS